MLSKPLVHSNLAGLNPSPSPKYLDQGVRIITVWNDSVPTLGQKLQEQNLSLWDRIPNSPGQGTELIHPNGGVPLGWFEYTGGLSLGFGLGLRGLGLENLD